MADDPTGREPPEAADAPYVERWLGPIAAEQYEKIDREAAELLRVHTPRKPGRPALASKKTSIEEAVGLLSRCVEYKIPPPASLLNLFKHLLKVRLSPRSTSTQPNLSAAQWEALECELQDMPDASDASPSWPSNAAAATVAAAAGVKVRTVERWRNKSDYQMGLGWLRDSKLVEEVSRRVANKLYPSAIPKEAISLAHLAHFHVAAKRGSYPVRSPIDGKMYENADDYVKHLLDMGREHGCNYSFLDPDNPPDPTRP